MMELGKFVWTRQPKRFEIGEDSVCITTAPGTDLWQRTYYGFRNDNAPLLQMPTKEKYFSFTVETHFEEAARRFDQCGIVLYLDSDNWLKASVEAENDRFSQLGSVVTNQGYSDWASTPVPASLRRIWYRLSRRESDYRIECSKNGRDFEQMRICHLLKGAEEIAFGIYACSPENSSFTARFTNFSFGPCCWETHDGQQSDP